MKKQTKSASFVTIEERDVTSSNINHLAFQVQENSKNKTTQSRMLVTFYDGSVYSYDNVPLETYMELVNAGSVGKAFHREIRGKYEFSKISEASTLSL